MSDALVPVPVELARECESFYARLSQNIDIRAGGQSRVLHATRAMAMRRALQGAGHPVAAALTPREVTDGVELIVDAFRAVLARGTRVDLRVGPGWLRAQAVELLGALQDVSAGTGTGAGHAD